MNTNRTELQDVEGDTPKNEEGDQVSSDKLQDAEALIDELNMQENDYKQSNAQSSEKNSSYQNR